MSTFNGLVSEFPDIRIDFFRSHHGSPPPLACFLSHAHSDHLAGLESLRSPFVYCSAATREVLLRLERYPCRINHAKGILEARQQTYKHLHKVLKPLPLETPAVLELQPGHHIQVTLLDANHCPGAVMFLIEGDGKAILFTGDIRSEPWHVNALARNPVLIEYAAGIKTLDKIYLDTSFIDDVPFQPKSEGLAELLRKVALYPKDTVFHFQAWTYGYEDVWVALSRFLESPIHVDDYKMRIYNSLKMRASEDRFSTDLHLTHEAPALVGYRCGNSPHPGCLTSDPGVRLHSCEKGSMCATAQGPSVVQIQPIVAHLPGGTNLAEVGVGGGADDLEREAELDVLTAGGLVALVQLISSLGDIPEQIRADAQRLLAQTMESGRNVTLDLDKSAVRQGFSASLDQAVESVTKRPSGAAATPAPASHSAGEQLPRTIQFPYSRHSSYPELCHLVGLFKPKDVWPCTVDRELWLKDGVTIRSLFGKYCSGQCFQHDLDMEALSEQRAEQLGNEGSQMEDTQKTDHSLMVLLSSSMSEAIADERRDTSGKCDADASRIGAAPTKEVICQSPETQSWGEKGLVDMSIDEGKAETVGPSGRSQKRDFGDFAEDGDGQAEPGDSQETNKSFTSTLSMRHSITRREAFYQMLENASTGNWGPIGLLSTDDHHTVLDERL